VAQDLVVLGLETNSLTIDLTEWLAVIVLDDFIVSLSHGPPSFYLSTVLGKHQE
jgi:hypothetical protein